MTSASPAVCELASSSSVGSMVPRVSSETRGSSTSRTVCTDVSDWPTSPRMRGEGDRGREDGQHGVVGQRRGQVGALVVAELAPDLARDVPPGPLLEVGRGVGLARVVGVGRGGLGPVDALGALAAHRRPRHHTRPPTRIAAPANAAYVIGGIRLIRAFGLRLDVQLLGELVDGVGELGALDLDLGLELLGGGLGHRRAPFTVAMSSLTPSMARSGSGGDAWATCSCRPARRGRRRRAGRGPR